MKNKKQRKYKWLSVVFSLAVPGLGLVAAGKIRRGILWFVMLNVPLYIALCVCKPFFFIYSSAVKTVEILCVAGTGCMSPTLGGNKNYLLMDRIIWNKAAYKKQL